MKTMEELPLQRNSMYASNVEKPLVLPVTWKHMNMFTLEWSPLHGSNVEKSLVYPPGWTSKNVKDFTLEQKILHVNNVGKPSFGLLKTSKNSQWWETLCMWAVWKSF
jgi:hypothetical protein